MPPRWDTPFDAPSPRDTALLAEVLGALREQLSDPTPDGPPAPEVQELISAAVTELHRLGIPGRSASGIAPVLGSGVVQELLRRRHDARPVLVDEPEPTVDERL